MGYIKEPEGVDFVINSEPLTLEDRKRISAFIADYKAAHKQKEPKATLRKRKKGGTKHHA